MSPEAEKTLVQILEELQRLNNLLEKWFNRG